MCDLLGNLLDVSKIESGQYFLNKSAHNINALAFEEVEKFQHVAKEKNIELHFEKMDSPNLMVDVCSIIQVMDNFIGNAIKFSPKNTKVFIKTENLKSWFRFSVKDQGPGISEENKKLAFKEFQTLGNKPTGGEKSTGLGLAISRKIIQLHEGQVGIISEIGKGSTFYFDLPILRKVNTEDGQTLIKND